MDVKYIPSDWEKMKDGIGDLIGLGRWGKGMIDTLKDLSDNLEDAESDIANYDSDGVISFHHTSQKSRYQGLFEDFEILHNFTGKVGEIVDRTIDQPFYEDMDAFVEAMRDLTISNYTTTNRVGATETQYVYAGYGPAQSFEVPKTEVSLDDLFSGDNYYASQMKLEYDAWKELNPDRDFTQEEYQQAVLNTRAFEYESIRNQQENKEFWVQIGALVVIVGTTLICPPAGIVLGAAYGAMELSSAVSGKDWVSDRELGTSERWFRGLLAPLDIVPGVSGLTKFSSTVRLAHLGENIGGIGLRKGVQGSIYQGITHIDNMVKTAGQQSVTRLKSASSAIIDTTSVMKNKLVKDTVEAGRLVDSAITQAKNITPSRRMGLAIDNAGDVGKVRIPVENTHAVENKLKEVLSRINGVNLGSGNSTGTVDVVKGSRLQEKFSVLMSLEDAKRYDQYWSKMEIGMNSEARVATGKLSSDSFVNKILPNKLKEHNISFDEFTELKLKPDYLLNDNERKIMQDIRDSVSRPGKNTTLIKNLPEKDIQKYLDGDYTSIKGFVAKAVDSSHIHEYSHVRESMRLDYSYYDDYAEVVVKPYPEDGYRYGYIEFKAKNPDMLSPENLEIPYGHTMNKPYSGWEYNEWPWTGNGFTSSRNDEVIPEWTLNKFIDLREGAKLHKVVDGKDEVIAIFDGKMFKLLQ
jgi:hypothetical protein